MPVLSLMIAGMLASASPHSEPQRCLLVVDGKTLVRGRCMVFPMGSGSFTLNTGRRVGHFAVVEVNGPGTATATWNAQAGDLHALDPLGTVTRTGACWSNARARICAWKQPRADCFDRTEPSLNIASGLLDTTTPIAIVSTVRTIYLGRVLRPATLAVIERGMIASARGPMRLRATLPSGWTVGDRTGTSDDYCNDFAFARRRGAAPLVMAAYYDAPGQAMTAQEAVLREVGGAIGHWAR